MNSFEEYSRFLTNYTTISGVWVRDQAESNAEIAFNPKLTEPAKFHQEREAHPDKLRAPSFSDNEFLDYAEGLKEVGRNIAKAKPDIVLIPMRGAVRPWEHLRVYCNISVQDGCLFPFTDKEKYSDETRGIIAEALKLHFGKRQVNVVCLDESEGGHGTRQLLDILSDLHQYDAKSVWTITLCLLVPKGREHAEWRYEHEGRTRDNFIVHAKLTGVTTVIGKDMDAAMISPENFGPKQLVKMRIEGADYVIETTEFPKLIDQKIVEATHYGLLAEPFWTIIDIQKWADARPK